VQNLLKIFILAAAGALGGFCGALLGDLAAELGTDETTLGMISSVACWMGAIGASISAAVLLTHRWYQRQRLGLAPLTTGVLSGLASGMISGAIAQTIYIVDISEQWRVFCWGIAGCLIGFSLSWHLSSIQVWRGALGGAIGGWIGSALFDVLHMMTADVVLA